MESYNCRHILYPQGEHVTFYARPVKSGIKRPKPESEKEVAPADRFDVAYIKKNMESIRKETKRKAENKAHCERTASSRAKNEVYRISRSNEWEWFITLTFRRTDIKASDYDVIVQKLLVFVNHLQQRKCPRLKYLIVSELHADRENYHFHGLLADCDGMRFTDSGHIDKSGNPIYNMPDWTYGFSTATRVKDTAKASSYITKYITKDVDAHLKDKHRYYKSRSCNICEADKLNIDERDFLEMYHDRITYAKTVDVPKAFQKCTYYELSD